jgi:hypothetical protein
LVDQEKQTVTGTFYTPSVGGATGAYFARRLLIQNFAELLSWAQDSSGNKARGVSDPSMKFSRSLTANSNILLDSRIAMRRQGFDSGRGNKSFSNEE